jgi:hypothetical protein
MTEGELETQIADIVTANAGPGQQDIIAQEIIAMLREGHHLVQIVWGSDINAGQ